LSPPRQTREFSRERTAAPSERASVKKKSVTQPVVGGSNAIDCLQQCKALQQRNVPLTKARQFVDHKPGVGGSNKLCHSLSASIRFQRTTYFEQYMLTRYLVLCIVNIVEEPQPITYFLPLYLVFEFYQPIPAIGMCAQTALERASRKKKSFTHQSLVVPTQSTAYSNARPYCDAMFL